MVIGSSATDKILYQHLGVKDAYFQNNRYIEEY